MSMKKPHVRVIRAENLKVGDVLLQTEWQRATVVFRRHGDSIHVVVSRARKLENGEWCNYGSITNFHSPDDIVMVFV